MRERGTLCESQRYLAQLLLEQGRIDEAEKYALAARETVSAEDTVSRATTRVALAQVRQLGHCFPRIGREKFLDARCRQARSELEVADAMRASGRAAFGVVLDAEQKVWRNQDGPKRHLDP